MIISHMIGGIGNQMFMYAFALNYSKIASQPLKFDLSSFKSKGYNNPEICFK